MCFKQRVFIMPLQAGITIVHAAARAENFSLRLLLLRSTRIANFGGFSIPDVNRLEHFLYFLYFEVVPEHGHPSLWW